MIRTNEELKTTLREIAQSEDAPVSHSAGTWKVKDRIVVWQSVAPKMFNEHLDRFAEVAIEVLGERNPQLDLEKEDRYMAAIYGKTLSHSSTLRRGIAETLALIGTHSEYLESVSSDKPREITYRVISEVLHDKDWDAWASLDDVLPLIAEANPEIYLSTVEAALSSSKAPLAGLFGQETSGFTSRTYMSGLLWSLEILAWDPDYLGRIVLALGELGAIDPGGNYANRPSNSLVTILLPWFPQTLAPVEKRIVAVKALRQEHPDVAWHLLLKLLPNSQQSSSMSHKPQFRQLIPDDWKEGSTNEEYWPQIEAYSQLAVEHAIEDTTRIPVLIDYLGNLTRPSMESFLEFLSSPDVTQLSDEEKLPIWNELFDFIVQNKKYAEAKWAAPPEIIERIETITTSLEPESASQKFQRLFVQRESDLYEQKDDFDLARTILTEKRIDAVRAIYEESGLDGLFEFARSVESPGHVGAAIALNNVEGLDDQILPTSLEDDRSSVLSFTYGYVKNRFQTLGQEWIANLKIRDWTANQHALFLAFLPFVPEVWTLAEKLPSEAARKYWERCFSNSYETEADLTYAIDRLLDVGRRVDAADLLMGAIYKKQQPNSDQIVRTLQSLEPGDVSKIGAHTIVHLIGSIQRDEAVLKQDLLRIEWTYLGILDGTFGASPIYLQKALATEAEFFCEVIRAVFRSKKGGGETSTVDERSETTATNGYRLLSEWKIPPGSSKDLEFNGEYLQDWLLQVKTLCAESGHLDIAMQQVGAVLYYAPPDPSGLWLHSAVANVLNAKAGEHLRLGFRMEIFNSRGVHFVDPDGKPERDLARNYRQKANDLELAGYIRLSATLRDIAADYDRQAQRIRNRGFDD